MYMLKKYVLLLCLSSGAVSALQGQATPTASKVFDIQAGGSFVGALAGYPLAPPHFKGYGIYSTIGFLPHIGLMLDFHQVYAPSPHIEYERTYEVGGRYVLHYGRLHPYAKVMYGRGVFNFALIPGSNVVGANLAYNLLGLGGGADFRLKPYLNLRADYEWQKWGSDAFLITNGISPQLFSIGAAYHFH
jgi:hypothetical protein